MIRLLFCSKSNILSNLKPPSLNNTSIIPKRNVSSKINKPNPEVFRPKSSKSKQENKDNHKVTPLGWFLIVSIILTSEIIVIYLIVLILAGTNYNIQFRMLASTTKEMEGKFDKTTGNAVENFAGSSTRRVRSNK